MPFHLKNGAKLDDAQTKFTGDITSAYYDGSNDYAEATVGGDL